MNVWSRQVIENWHAVERKKLNRFVAIDYERLGEIAERHAPTELDIPNWRFAGVYPEHEWTFAALQPAANCFNAAYNIPGDPDAKFSVVNPDSSDKPYSGAFAMYRALYIHFGERVIQAPNLYPYVESPGAMSLFFGGIKKMPFADLKARCGLDYVVGLEKYVQGNPPNLLEEAMTWDKTQQRSVIRAFNNGRGLVELLINKFPVAYGEDVQTLYGYTFPFYKRTGSEFYQKGSFSTRFARSKNTVRVCREHTLPISRFRKTRYQFNEPNSWQYCFTAAPLIRGEFFRWSPT